MLDHLLSEEKKVKKYLEDNYQHRSDLVSPDPDLADLHSRSREPSAEAGPKKYQGVGPQTKDGKSWI